MHRLRPDGQYATLLIFGNSGVGKTRVAATAPKPILILNKDNGTMSLMNIPEFEKGVFVEDVISFEHLEECRRNLAGIGKKDWTHFKTVVIDDLSSVQAMIMEELIDKAVARDTRREVDEAQQRDYGIMGLRMRRVLKKFQELKMHKIWVSSMATDKDTGLLVPGLIGAMRNVLPHMTDATMFMRIGKGSVRKLYLDGSDTFISKTRAWWIQPRVIRCRDEDRTTLTRLLKQIALTQSATKPATKKEK